MKKTVTLEVELDKFEPILRLSPTEYSVFCALGRGLSRKEIVFKRGVSPKTVDTHIGHIKSKLNMSIEALVHFACEYNIVSTIAHIERTDLDYNKVVKTKFVEVAA